MMPLTLANSGEDNMILKVGGNAEVKRHLEDLGFVAGANVTVVSSMSGNLIVNVKDSRVAISKEMAGKIMV
jgi:ferrous iron transport protein A